MTNEDMESRSFKYCELLGMCYAASSAVCYQVALKFMGQEQTADTDDIIKNAVDSIWGMKAPAKEKE